MGGSKWFRFPSEQIEPNAGFIFYNIDYNGFEMKMATMMAKRERFEYLYSARK